MNNYDEAVKRNLFDAGCGEQLIRQITLLQAECKTDEILLLLAKQRKNLLDGVHTREQQIYCLDYFVNKLKKQL